jgi:alkylation response protein AidB-like acyl-CoA dehydrogenase
MTDQRITEQEEAKSAPDEGRVREVGTEWMGRAIFEPEHDAFRESVRRFFAKEAVPYREAWEQAGQPDRAFWTKAAEHGFVGFEAPVELGGLGIHDFRFNAILNEEAMYAGVSSDLFQLENDCVLPYLLNIATPEQRQRFIPRFVAGELLGALGMTEPGTGSDLRAISTRAQQVEDGWTLNGAKTFITSGIQADFVIVVAQTTREPGPSSLSLLLVEDGMDGFTRGRKLDKIGHRDQDTAELFFDNVLVPHENVLGRLGGALEYLRQELARERLAVAVGAVAASEATLRLTLDYVKERKAFGRPVGDFQANRFALAQLWTEVAGARCYVDACIMAENRGTLSATEAAGLKALTTELHWRVVDRCLQLHGGYGYMEEYAIARMWRDARVLRIYGGTTEIMWDIVGRAIQR